MIDDSKLPASTRKLVAALLEFPPITGRDVMLERARSNWYHDFESTRPMPIGTLVADARHYGFDAIARRAMDGDFDATYEESQAWAASPEGQRTLATLGPKGEALRRRR